MASRSESDSTASKSGRKTYVRPKLRSYGNIREITMAVGKSGAKDGSTVMGMRKTAV